MTVVNVMHQVTDHARQLLEKHFRQPFLNLDYGAGIKRMDAETVQEGLVWLDDFFHIIRHQVYVCNSVGPLEVCCGFSCLDDAISSLGTED